MQSFDAFVTAAHFQSDGRAVFALGDGTVRIEGAEVIFAHPEATVLCAAPHPSGEGIVTGGDDGRVVWTTAKGPVELAALAGGWIDAVAASAESGMIAFAAGRTVETLDVKEPLFRRSFAHERSVSGLAFDPKGRKLACATYGGCAVWFARIADQKPQMFKWAGSHIAAAWSPDGRFLVSAMQENMLHGWRVADAKDMRMSGYAAKPRSIAFLARGQLMATSGAQGAVVWPFRGNNGPMGEQAAEVGHREGSATVTQVAARVAGSRLAVGTSDGRVWFADVDGTQQVELRDGGGPISALALSADGRRIAWGDEEGAAGVVDL
jgi:WD40 repeat protein